MLLCLQTDSVQLTVVPHEEVGGHGQSPRRGADNVAEVAKTIVIGVGWKRRIEPHAIRGQQIGDARGMHTQRQDHRRRLRAVIGNLIAGSYLHRNTLRYMSAKLSRPSA